MKPSNILTEHGITLTEIMVSTGLFAYVALMAGTLFTEGTRMVVTARAQSDFSQQLIAFNDNVDTIIANTVRIRSCSCGVLGTQCLYSPSDTTQIPAACGSTYTAAGGESPCDFLDFDADVAGNPSQTATSACIGNSSWAGFTGKTAAAAAAAPGLADSEYQMTPMGCKERYKLRFVPPTRNTVSGTNYKIGTPGEIQLVRISATSSATESVVARINGVHSFRCGFDSAFQGSTSIGAPTGFRLDIDAKTRNTPTSFAAAETIESFAPQDGTMFTKGIHRTLAMNIQYRNLSSESIQFGRTVSFRGCVSDGTSSPTADCCSGYYSRSTSQCLAASTCIPAGGTISGSDTFERCCSHKLYQVGGINTCS